MHIGLNHPGKMAGILVLLVCAGIVGTFRVSWVEDITALLPRQEDSLLTLSRELGMMRRVAIVLTSPKPSDPKLHAAISRLETALAGLDDVTEVMGEVDAETAMASARVLMAHSVGVYEPSVAMNETLARERLAALKRKLASPEAMLMGEHLLQDPFGLSWTALGALESMGAAMGQVVEQGHLLSSDRRHALVMATVGFDPMDVDRSARFVRSLDALIAKMVSAKSGIEVTALGGVHHAALTAASMKGDIALTFALTVALVLVVFLLFFGRLRAMPAALLPAGVGILVTLGLGGLFGIRIHALTLGFAATITGISIDYVIHLLHRAESETGGSRPVRMARALDSVAKPILLGCLTTVGAFAIVTFSGFTGIRQLALFSLVSLPIALGVTLFVLPGWARLLLSPSPARSGAPPAARMIKALYGIGHAKHRVGLIMGFAVVLVISVWCATRVTLSGDPRDLGHRSPDIERREAVVKAAFPGVFDHVVLVASNRNPKQAFDTNDALYDALITNGIAKNRIVSVSPFLPGERRQKAAVAALQKALPEQTVRRLLTEAGFEPTYIERTVSDMRRADLTPQLFENTSLAALIENGVHQVNGVTHVVTRISGGDDATLAVLERVAAAVGAKIVSERLEISATLTRLQHELVWMLCLWLGAALLMLTIVERSVRFGLFAALPALFGVAAAVGLFGLSGRPLTPVASAGITLVMGLGIDYGIFMQQPRDHLMETATAVGASALTTLAAFGVLAISDIRAMADIGLIILVGLSAAFFTALFLVPALRSKDEMKEAR